MHKRGIYIYICFSPSFSLSIKLTLDFVIFTSVDNIPRKVSIEPCDHNSSHGTISRIPNGCAKRVPNRCSRSRDTDGTFIRGHVTRGIRRLDSRILRAKLFARRAVFPGRRKRDLDAWGTAAATAATAAAETRTSI